MRSIRTAAAVIVLAFGAGPHAALAWPAPASSPSARSSNAATAPARAAPVDLPMPPPPPGAAVHKSEPERPLEKPKLTVPPKPKLVVLELTVAGGVEPQLGSALTEAVTTEVASRGFFDVLSSKEIQTMMGQERQRQLLGCTDDASSCLAELAGAIGARFVLSGSVAKLGSAYQITLQTLDTSKAVPIGRSTRIAADLVTLRAQLPYAVAEATATPLPPPPSRLLPYSLMVGGGLGFAVGGLLTFNALSQEGSIARELNTAASKPSVLQPLATYQQQRNAVILQKAIGLSAMAVGAAALGLGLFLNPNDAPRGSVQVAVLPSVSGVAFAGVWP